MRNVFFIQKLLEPGGRAQNLGPVAIANIDVDPGQRERGNGIQISAHGLGVGVKDRRAVRADCPKHFPIRQPEMDRPAAAAREPADSSILSGRAGAVSFVNVRNKLFDKRLREAALGRLAAITLVRHHDDQGRDLAGSNQPVGSLVRADAVPLLIREALPMDQIKHGVALGDGLVVAGR